MRNPPDSKKRPRDEENKSIVSLARLRELEEQLGYAMSKAGIVKMEREKSGKVKANGANLGSSGTMIYSLGSIYNRDLLKATLLKKSFSEVSASQIKKDSFVRFQRQLNADDLRLIYNQIKDVPRVNLDSYNLNLLCELKNVFLQIDKNKGFYEEDAQKPLTAGEREAKFFAKNNKSLFATQTRQKLEEPKSEKSTLKRQKTSENWWDDLTADFVPVIGAVTNNILASSFLGGFGISFPRPEEKKSVKASDLPSREGVQIFRSELIESNSSSPSSQNIKDRPSTFLNHLKDAPVLDSTVFSSSESLTARMKLWNSYMKKCNSPTENIQHYEDSRGNGNTPEEKRITKYSEYLQASIEKIKTLKSEQGKILSGFLYLELAKVEHMVTGKNAYVDDNGSFSTREAKSVSLYSTEGLGVMDSMRKYARKFSSSGEYKGDEVTPPNYQSSQPSNSEGLDKIKQKLYSKIPETSQDAIYYAQNAVSKDVNFVDTINVPLTVKTSHDFKSNFSQKIATFWKKIKPSTYTLPPSAQAQAQAQVPAPSPSPSPSLEKPSLTDEAQSVKDKISGNYTGVQNLQRIVDSPINFSESIFDVTSKIDIAIGVMEPKSTTKQESYLVSFIKDSKGLLKRGDAARGRSGGSDSRRENIYAYVAFLDDRIKILQDVVNDLKSSNPSQNMSIPTLKKMQANLGLELVRISDSLTPQEDLIGQFQAPHRVSWKNTDLDPFGSVHHEDSLKTLRAEAMKEKLGKTFASMLDSNRFEGRESFAYSDKKVASANQDFLKEKVDEALKNFNNIRIENRGGGKGR